MLYIEIVADTNDTDYVCKITKIRIDELESLDPLFEAIKNFKPYTSTCDSYNKVFRHNWPTGNRQNDRLGEKSPKEIYSDINPDVIDMFEEEFCPFSSEGIHTIYSIKTYEKLFEEVII